MASSRVFVVAAKRTPFGTFGGKLKGVNDIDICKVAATAALKAGKVAPEAVDSVIIGNVAQVLVNWCLHTNLLMYLPTQFHRKTLGSIWKNYSRS